MRGWLTVFIYLLGFGLFLLKGFLVFDPDFGWHWKMGELIFQNGLPQTDPFSYTMPSYPFIDHEWLTNVLIYKLYNWVGTSGLSLIYAVLALLSFIVVTQGRVYLGLIGVYFLSLVELYLYVGIRPQVETLLLFAIATQICLSQQIWSKWKFILPILMILWVNLHGGFAIGIAVITLKVATESFLKKVLIISDLVVLFLSLLSTFINPYGLRIWHEIFMQLTDNSLRWYISEWVPALFKMDFVFWILIALSSVLVASYCKKLSLFEQALFWGVLVASISSVRHIPLWVLVMLYLIQKCSKLLYGQIKNNSYSLKITRRFGVIFCLISFLSASFYLSLVVPKGFKNDEETLYPQKAVEYLKANRVNGQMFALYGWGGYLDWKLPQKKVFIDGRMPSWRGHQAVGESEYAFKDYREIIESGVDLDSKLQKYNIQLILWSVEKRVKEPPPKIEIPFLTQLLGLNKDSFSYRLEKLGWQVVYQDQVATIFQRP